MAQKILVLFILPDLSGGGAERTVVNILKYIDRDRFTPALALLSHKGEYLSLVDAADISCIELPRRLQHLLDLPSDSIHSSSLDTLLPRLRRVPATICQIRAIAKALNPDIILTSMTGLNILASFAFSSRTTRKFKWIARDGNNFTTNIENLFKHKIIQNFLFKLIRQRYLQADSILAISKASAAELSSEYKIPTERVSCIYNPVDLNQIWQVISSKKQSLRNRSSREHSSRNRHLLSVQHIVRGDYIIAVGRLNAQKGFDDLLNALSICHHQYQLRSLGLLILGEGSLRQTLEAQVQALSLQRHVVLAGFVDTPWKHMAKARAFVLSSRWEGFAHVLVEAMACRVPVVATDCDYGPKEIIENGNTGLLVTPSQPAYLAKAISDLVKNPLMADRLVDNALSRAKDFDAAKIVREYEKLFTEVVSR